MRFRTESVLIPLVHGILFSSSLLLLTRYSTLFFLRKIDDPISTTSGVTGSLFVDTKIRRYSGPTNFSPSKLESFGTKIVYAGEMQAKQWGVCTTINHIGEAIEAVLSLPGWKVVVVADIKTPNYRQRENMIFLSISMQMSMREKFQEFIDLIPWNHFGRKNIGYLYAIMHGAEIIFDFDDDNVLKSSFMSIKNFQKSVKGILPETVCNLTANAYKLMGGPRQEVPSWPRGFPLDLVRSECFEKLESGAKIDEIGIYQSLADHEPDVDAIYRLTRKTPFNFDSKHQETINFPVGVFTPFNAQATFYLYPAFWTLLLPITVHGRVSDIWRSYIGQTLLWKVNKTIAITAPVVVQNRNAHNLLADFDAEADLYKKSHALVALLARQDVTKSDTNPLNMYGSIMIDMYERGYVAQNDVKLLQVWLKALCSISYEIDGC